MPTQTPEEDWSDHMQNHQADSPLYVWPDVWSADLQVYKKYGNTWHRMSLLRPGVIKQHKTKPSLCVLVAWCPSWWFASTKKEYDHTWHRMCSLRPRVIKQQESQTQNLTLTVLNFWKFTSYCSLKPLWSGMGEVVPARTSPTLHPPSPPTVYQLSWLAL